MNDFHSAAVKGVAFANGFISNRSFFLLKFKPASLGFEFAWTTRNELCSGIGMCFANANSCTALVHSSLIERVHAQYAYSLVNALV